MELIREELTDCGDDWTRRTQWLKDGSSRTRRLVINYLDGKEVSRYYA